MAKASYNNIILFATYFVILYNMDIALAKKLMKDGDGTDTTSASLSSLPESDEEEFDWAASEGGGEDDYDYDDGGGGTSNSVEDESYDEKIVLGKGTAVTAEDFRTSALEFINLYRSNHGAPPLIIDPTLNTQAQAWADNLTATNTLDYSCKPNLSTPATVTTWKMKPKNCKFSEGIALVEANANMSTAARTAVQQWYREGLKYSYKYGPPTPTVTTGQNVLDFTAMLWKASKKVGFGLGTDKNGEIVFVANYAPAGNVVGEYGKNVLP